jgi:hypothetical protein
MVTSAMLITSPPAQAQGAAAAAALAPLCQAPYTGLHYGASANSGYGTNKGTGGYQYTWTSWSLNGHSDGFSNEAVWTLDNNNGSNALEVGFSVGRSLNGGYENYQYPYYTINNGNNETDYFGTVLPTGTLIWNSATSDGTHSWAYVNNKFLAEINYGVATPRLNYEQAEVNYHDIWLGGGSGSYGAYYYQSAANNNWYAWGWIGTQLPNNSGSYGYFINRDSSNAATEGGYGHC